MPTYPGTVSGGGDADREELPGIRPVVLDDSAGEESLRLERRADARELGAAARREDDRDGAWTWARAGGFAGGVRYVRDLESDGEVSPDDDKMNGRLSVKRSWGEE